MNDIWGRLMISREKVDGINNSFRTELVPDNSMNNKA